MALVSEDAEYFIDVTLVIGDTYGDDVRGNKKWRHLVAKSTTNTSGATWWLNL